jgi:prolipoprotein diacylglyceryltransferase
LFQDLIIASIFVTFICFFVLFVLGRLIPEQLREKAYLPSVLLIALLVATLLVLISILSIIHSLWV